MKTYKSGISLIVLVITVIVLAILATTVIISLNNTNIISETGDTVFKSDMSSYRELYSFYLADKLMEDETFDSSTLNVTSDDAEFTEIFGNNVSAKYEKNLEIIAGRLVYKTNNAEQVDVLKELNMAVTVIPSDMQVGDTVSYTPTADPTEEYSGATYNVSDEFGRIAEGTTKYKPGSMTWVYLGQDENGNALLTSQGTTTFTMYLEDQDAWVTGPDRMDTLCNTLYGNSTYGTARNMKIEDVDRVLGYDGPLGSYAITEWVYTPTPMTFGEIEKEEESTMGGEMPRLSKTSFEEQLSNQYTYSGASCVENTTNEYIVIFGETTNHLNYWLSSACARYGGPTQAAWFSMRNVISGNVSSIDLYGSNTRSFSDEKSLRPVIVLGSNIQFGEKNSNGEWTLVEM